MHAEKEMAIVIAGITQDFQPGFAFCLFGQQPVYSQLFREKGAFSYICCGATPAVRTQPSSYRAGAGTSVQAAPVECRIVRL
jgi:hypothetical protein